MYIDAHAHVDRYDLVDERAQESALAEITQHSILTIGNSMDLPSYERTLEISKACSLVLPTFGVHPWNAPEYADRLDELSGAIEHSPMLGGIGLDHYFVQDACTYDGVNPPDGPCQPNGIDPGRSAARGLAPGL